MMDGVGDDKSKNQRETPLPESYERVLRKTGS
jgi:hypothetical protein